MFIMVKGNCKDCSVEFVKDEPKTDGKNSFAVGFEDDTGVEELADYIGRSTISERQLFAAFAYSCYVAGDERRRRVQRAGTIVADEAMSR